MNATPEEAIALRFSSSSSSPPPMVMAAKNIQSDLRALKRLYGLLKNDGDGTSNTDSDLLDEHSRLVLKNLLDAATKRVLRRVHLEVIGCPLEESRSCEQEKDTDKDLKMDGLDVTLWKDKRPTGGVEQPIQGVPVSGRQKLCRVCQRNTVKQLESMHLYVDANDDDMALNSSSTSTDLQENESDHCLWNSEQGIRLSPLNNERSEEPESDKGRQREHCVSSNLDGVDVAEMCNYDIDTRGKPDCLSEEASEAIKQIELCISASHIGADQLLQLFEKNHCVPEIKSAMPKQYGEDKLMTTSNLQCEELSSQRVVNPVGLPIYCWLPPDQPYLSSSQICRLFEATNAMVRQSSTNNFIRREGPTLQSDDGCKFPTKTMNKKKIYGRNVKGIIDKIESGKWRTSPDQLVDSATYLQHKDGISRNRQYARTHLQHQESASTGTDSCQQSSSHDSDSEEYSFTDDTRESPYMSSSRSSGCQISSTGTQYSSSYTTSSEEEVYSYSSRDGAPQMTSTSSSRSEGFTPKKSGPSRIHRAYGINHKKHLGAWKRLKDRLAIIFHHHHPHHHHYGDRTEYEAKMSHKRQGKVVNFKRQDKAYGKKAAAEKIKKPVVREKGQHSHFHGLVEGLLRHVRHSKQSKSGKGAVDHLVKGKPHGRSKTLNKSHWWQLLQHHSGAKFQNRTHVKFVSGKEKARFKALPDFK